MGRPSVALRKEGVDRNWMYFASVRSMLGSPSARRAWIEMRFDYDDYVFVSVALRKEGVDRNMIRI